MKLCKFTPHFLFSLFLCACSSLPDEDFDKQQAAKARVELALGYLAQNNPMQAKLNLDKALNYAPDYYLVHSALAYFHHQQGNIELADNAYRKAISLDDDQGDVHNNYGTFLCSLGKAEQGIEQFRKALSAKYYYNQTDTYENLAICAYSVKNRAVYQESIDLLRKISPTRAAELESLRF
ncbi:type IV pilus biogenesis/stability protein PilW [Actinobacillus succinogenes]|uniref:Type IV pilus biogenesis/stability protein PilW n=1 Tax=Actinobacillus succinogenes (strain ATCC 55618 / DSM 22257 / CCUG 43843 / 130Z) TaxID=339671 RepID=A6VQX8_ACTSZ|nr:type IV pilus biogenesis/stability protein PilW [Actinobacillus succinogenes]ABR75375.1 type IV pilus biogenesis/stability protein PilW [Actinobacillus succinogenes 130Z]PHI40236.1 type IV pilus biogenesis/stability protein PilW [Actinobacillus succinogenes]